MTAIKRRRPRKGFPEVLASCYRAEAGMGPDHPIPEPDAGDDLADQIYGTLRALESDSKLKTSKGRLSSAYVLLNDVANQLDIVASKQRSTKRRPMVPLAFPAPAEPTSYDLYVVALRLWNLASLLGPQKSGSRPLTRRQRPVGRPSAWYWDEGVRALLLSIVEQGRAWMKAQGMRPTNADAIEAFLRADDQELPPGEQLFKSGRKRKEFARRLAKRIPDLRRSRVLRK